MCVRDKLYDCDQKRIPHSCCSTFQRSTFYVQDALPGHAIYHLSITHTGEVSLEWS